MNPGSVRRERQAARLAPTRWLALALRVALAVLASASAGVAVAQRPTRELDVRQYGAKGDGVKDDSRAIQAALDAARVGGGGVVFFPAGTYLVAPPGASAQGATLASLTIGSNTWLRGQGPSSVLKVKAGTGSYRALFSNHPAAASHVENVVISDLRFDQNCSAGTGDVRPGGDGGHLFILYLAWGGRNVTVERTRFDPVCGVNTLVLNAVDASELTVRDNYFRFVKGPTTDPSGFYDNSAVYFHGRGAAVTGNVFESTAADGARGAIELHGARAAATGNVTRWYHACVRIAGTSGDDPPPSAGNGFTVTDNTCLDAKDAINVWSVTRHHVRGVVISGNTITLAENQHLAVTRSLDYFFGISFTWDSVSRELDGDVSDVVIERNTITAEPAERVWGAHADTTGGICLRSAGNISNVLVRGNVLRDLPTKGVHLQAMGRGKRATNVRIEENALVNPGNDPAAGPDRAGIVLGGVLEDIEVAHNSITSTMVPFRGLYAILLRDGPGVRVAIHDNALSIADPKAAYR